MWVTIRHYAHFDATIVLVRPATYLPLLPSTGHGWHSTTHSTTYSTYTPAPPLQVWVTIRPYAHFHAVTAAAACAGGGAADGAPVMLEDVMCNARNRPQRAQCQCHTLPHKRNLRADAPRTCQVILEKISCSLAMAAGIAPARRKLVDCSPVERFKARNL